MDVSRLPVAAVGRWLRSVRPERAHLRADLVAGLPGAISSVPDGMAAASWPASARSTASTRAWSGRSGAD